MKRRLFFLSILLLFLSGWVRAEGGEGTDKVVADLLRQAAIARDSYDQDKALSLYKLVLTRDSVNLEAMFNLGMIIQEKGWLLEEKNKDLAFQYYKEAKTWADKTYRLYPNTFEANLSMAGTIGRLAKFVGTKERVQAAWDIKKYADAAYKIKPSDPHLIHLLAWWNFELSKPSWFERSMADMLFGGLPRGNVQTAIQDMIALIQSNPNYVVYGYDLARFYQHIGNKVKAIESLKRVILLTPHAPEEFSYIQAAKRLLLELQ